MNDSMTSLALRQARRSWPLLLIVALLGTVAAGTLTLRRAKVTAKQTIEVARVSELSSLLQIEAVPNVDVRQIAYQMASEYEQNDLSRQVAIRLTPDTVADTVTVDATGQDRATLLEAMALISDGLTKRARDPRLLEARQVIAASDKVLTDLEDRASDLEATLLQLAPGDSGRDLTLVSLVGVQTSLADARAQAVSMAEYESFLETSLVRIAPVDLTEAPGIEFSSLAAGLIGALVLAIAALYVAVALDRRARRCLHLEQAAPSYAVIGLLPRQPLPDSIHAELFRTALGRAVAAPGIDQVVIVGASDVDSELSVLALFPDGHAGTATISGTSTELPSPSTNDPESTAVVLAAHFGKTREDRVAAVASELEAAGYRCITTCLTHVPGRDLDWASRRAGHAASGPAHAY